MAAFKHLAPIVWHNSHMSNEILGKASHHVAQNLQILRTQQKLSLRQLEAKLATNGHRIPFAAIGNIESGKRGIDVDELFALAEALGVGISGLLFSAGQPSHLETVEISKPDGRKLTVKVDYEQIRQHHAGEWPIWVEEPVVTPDQLWELAEYATRMNPETRARLLPDEVIPSTNDQITDKKDQVLRSQESSRPTTGESSPERNPEDNHGHPVADDRVTTLGTDGYLANFQYLLFRQITAARKRLESALGSWEGLAPQIIEVDKVPEDLREDVAEIWATLRELILPRTSAIRFSSHRFVSRQDVELAEKIEADALDLQAEVAAVCDIRTRVKEDGERKVCFTDGRAVIESLPPSWPEDHFPLSLNWPHQDPMRFISKRISKDPPLPSTS